MGADDGKEYVARRDLGIQMNHEVDPSRNVVDVHEQASMPKRLRQPVVQSTGRGD